MTAFYFSLWLVFATDPPERPPAKAEPSIQPATTVIVVVGAPGTPEYSAEFSRWATRWQTACVQAGARHLMIGQDPDFTSRKSDAPAHTAPVHDRERLREILQAEPPTGHGELWLVLIGHGTFDGRTAKFNLRGPDLTPNDLADWLKPIQRPLVVINSSACSGPFLQPLAAPNRVVLTATRSGHERNFARLGDYLSAALLDARADLDKDEQVSLLEAWLSAHRDVTAYYHQQGRLLTEHSLLDDTGDGQGTPADWFRGTRAERQSESGAPVDGRRSHQIHLQRRLADRNLPPALLTRRNQLEIDLANLRDQKATLPATDYFARLEPLLVELARNYQAADRLATTNPPPKKLP